MRPGETGDVAERAVGCHDDHVGVGASVCPCCPPRGGGGGRPPPGAKKPEGAATPYGAAGNPATPVAYGVDLAMGCAGGGAGTAAVANAGWYPGASALSNALESCCSPSRFGYSGGGTGNLQANPDAGRVELRVPDGAATVLDKAAVPSAVS